MRLLKKRVILPVAVVSALAVSAAAFAAWTATGSGTATAAATTAQNLTITTPTGATGLYPTGSVGLGVKIDNPNPYAVEVLTIAQDSAKSITTTAPGCDPSAVTFNSTSGQGLHVKIPAQSSATMTLTNAVWMSNAALDACQGATFQVPLTLTGQSTTLP